MIAWLIKLTGSEKYAYLILAVIAAVTGATLCAASYWRGYQAADQKALVKLLKKSNQELQTQVTDAQEKLTQLERFRDENKRLTKDLVTAQGQERIVYRTLREFVWQAAPETLVVSQENSRGDHGAMCALTPEFVRLWNIALFPDTANRMPYAADVVSHTVTDTSVADTVSEQDILTNHIDNAEIARSNFRQCSVLIEWHNTHDNHKAAE